MKTALITGASEGIGLELTRLFAQNHMNLVLVARNEIRLQEIKNEVSQQGIAVSLYARDLSKIENAMEIYNDLKSKSISVDYLVNNAGFGIDDEYTEIPWQRELEMFNLNMITLAYFTKEFAKDMKSRGFGRILNLGSTGSFQPGPYMAGYCATKAFVLNLSEAVNYELKNSGVSVTTLCPGVTKTKFHDVAQTGQTLMSKILAQATPKDVAKYGFKLMMKGKQSGIHGLMNKLMIFSIRFGTRKLVVAMSAKLLKSKK
ncbi:MAG TPA: SDR family oxidoreductase [Bacteroidales bacterium]